MRFLIDADLPRRTKKLLESYGHPAEDVRDIGLKHAKDPQIAEYAKANGLCLITADWGFSDIRSFPPDEYEGIIVVGVPEGVTGAYILNVIRTFLENEEFPGHIPKHLVILEKGRVRFRPS